jgi:hypothetical protein
LLNIRSSRGNLKIAILGKNDAVSIKLFITFYITRGKPTEQEGEAVRLCQLPTIPLAPNMHGITEARTHGILWLYKSQRKASTEGEDEKGDAKENRGANAERT